MGGITELTLLTKALLLSMLTDIAWSHWEDLSVCASLIAYTTQGRHIRTAVSYVSEQNIRSKLSKLRRLLKEITLLSLLSCIIALCSSSLSESKLALTSSNAHTCLSGSHALTRDACNFFYAQHSWLPCILQPISPGMSFDH